MIRKHYILTVFKKELLETIRDKKTILINIALPVLVWPAMTVFITQYAATQTLKQQAKISRIALIGDDTPEIETEIKKSEKLEIIDLDKDLQWDLALLPEPKNKNVEIEQPLPALMGKEKENSIFTQAEFLIQDNAVDALLIRQFQPFDHDGQENVKVWILYDGTYPDSDQAADRLIDVLEELSETLVDERLDQIQLEEEFLQPLKLATKNVAGKKKTTSNLVGRILPLMLIFLIVIGGFYPAITMTAGEKEHGTLPTILCSPISHLELLGGKYLAIMVITLIGVSLNVGSISAVIYFGMAELPLNFSPMIVVCIFVSLIPLSMLFIALFIGVAIFANNFREGQNLLSPVTLIAILPAYSAILPGTELNAFTAMIPGVNISLLIRDILVRPINFELVFATLLANTAWTLGILVLTARIFKSEQVLLSGTTTIADVFTLDRDAMPRPTLQLCIILFAVFLMGTFYLSGALLQFGIAVLVPVLQLGLFLAVPLGVALYFKMDIKNIFRLRMPGIGAVLGAVLTGSTIFIATSWVGSFTKPPEEYEKLLVDALQLTDPSISFPLILILIAVLPGLCEELAYRGMMLSGFLSNFKPIWAIMTTAACFACAHFSIYNLLPLFLMGVVLSYTAWRTNSIWPGIIIHTINNGLGVVASRYEADITRLLSGVEDSMYLPLMISGAASLTVIGMVLISYSRNHDGITEG
jgi:sodium transport system permease protein